MKLQLERVEPIIKDIEGAETVLLAKVKELALIR
jgi:hypothetical protein